MCIVRRFLFAAGRILFRCCKACCHVWAARRSQRQVLAEHTARQRTRSVPCLRRAACVPKRCRRARRRVLTALSVILSVWHAHIFFRKMAISGVYCRHRKRRAPRARYKALSRPRALCGRSARAKNSCLQDHLLAMTVEAEILAGVAGGASVSVWAVTDLRVKKSKVKRRDVRAYSCV
jgi:hypothetical protein